MGDRKIKVEEALHRLAATFIEREAEKNSLITVTRIDLAPDFHNATIFISVLPDNKAEDALNFCKRKMTDFKNYVKQNVHMNVIPFFEVELDIGEKNRQRIEELEKENKVV